MPYFETREDIESYNLDLLHAEAMTFSPNGYDWTGDTRWDTDPQCPYSGWANSDSELALLHEQAREEALQRSREANGYDRPYPDGLSYDGRGWRDFYVNRSDGRILADSETGSFPF